MSSWIVQSQTQQPILKSLNRAVKTKLEYQIEDNVGPVSNQLVKVVPQVAPSSSVFDTQIQFRLPRVGMLDNLLIESKFTATRPADIDDHTAPYEPQVGENLFKRIDILGSNGLPIYSQTSAALKAKISAIPVEQAMAIRHRTVPRDATTNAVFAWKGSGADTPQVVVYTPIFSAFLDDIKASIDLTMCDEITVRCTFNSSSELADFSAGKTTWGSFVCSLYMRSHIFANDYKDELRAANFSEKTDKTMTIFSHDWYEETKDASVAGDVEVDLRCSGSALETYVLFKDANKKYQPVTKVSFKLNGTTHYESLPADVLSLFGDTHGSGEPTYVQGSNLAAAPAPFTFDNKVCKISYGLMPGNEGFNSGAVNFKGLNNPTLKVTVPAAGTVIVVHKLVTLVTVTENGEVGLTSTA